MNKDEFLIKAIGLIKIDKNSFKIEIRENYKKALIELEDFSHIQVLWWCHLFDDESHRKMVSMKKPYKKGPEEIGVFATRSPVRPNPVAVTNVPVIGIDTDSGVITIPWIDAENGTPVIDIKPYHKSERIKKATVPKWCSHWPEWYEDSADFNWAAEFSK